MTVRARRSILFHGLRMLLLNGGVLLWTYAANLAVALLFSLRLHAQLSSVLDHSLAAERLNSAFDLGTMGAVMHRLGEGVGGGGASNYAGQPLYLLLYFVLVPGTLVCFATRAPSRLANLLSFGLQFFWRFFRIVLLTLLGSVLVLGPLLAAQVFFANRVDESMVGWKSRLLQWAGWLVVLLVAALLRLYFDLVECYTVLLNEQVRVETGQADPGRPDSRVRRVLLPAFRTLRGNFARAYGSFLLLTLLGLAAFVLLGRVAMHMLAQPRVWPMFLLAQAGLFLTLMTRFWQRGAEMTLAEENPLPPPFLPPRDAELVADPIPDPEPASPSLPEPDPGVFEAEQS